MQCQYKHTVCLRIRNKTSFIYSFHHKNPSTYTLYLSLLTTTSLPGSMWVFPWTCWSSTSQKTEGSGRPRNIKRSIKYQKINSNISSLILGLGLILALQVLRMGFTSMNFTQKFEFLSFIKRSCISSTNILQNFIIPFYLWCVRFLCNSTKSIN